MIKSYKIPKKQYKDDGSWDYIRNEKFHKVITYMKDHNLTSIVDLGAGDGHCLSQAFNINYTIKGYEYNKDLINKSLTKEFIEHKNIFDLTKADIEDYEVVYSYAPFWDDELRLNFFELMKSLLSKDQIFLYVDDFYRKRHVIFHSFRDLSVQPAKIKEGFRGNLFEIKRR